jgi:hypothetical protein
MNAKESAMSSQCKVPPVKASGLTFVPDEVILYGMDLVTPYGAGSDLGFARIEPEMKETDQKWDIYLLGANRIEDPPVATKNPIGLDLLRQAIENSQPRTFAAVYGYAYEGSCYRLDKPKILVFKSRDGAKPAKGCGYEGADLQYSMWRVRASDMLVEMTVNSDTFQKLILEQNLPGRRAPNTYAATMIQGGGVAHRGGRLVEP